jgi:hypothetical protein
MSDECIKFISYAPLWGFMCPWFRTTTVNSHGFVIKLRIPKCDIVTIRSNGLTKC